MDLNKINPYVRYASYSILQPNYIIAERSILDYELVYIEAGNLRLIYDGTAYTCIPGDIILLHPGIEHSFTVSDAGLSQPHIHFDLIYDELSLNKPISFKSRSVMTSNELHMIAHDDLSLLGASPILHLSEKEKFLQIFFSLIDQFQSGNKQSAISIRVKMLQLIEMILAIEPSYLSAQTNPTNDFELEIIKQYIDANHYSLLNLEMLETHFHYNRFSISHQFKMRYGEPVMKYYNRKRMETAHEMLKTEPVTEVASALSFSSIYSFSRAFKNVYGYSPSEVKQRDNVFQDEKGKKIII